MDALAIFNSFEAAFWIVIGVTVWSRSRQIPRMRRIGFIAATWFVLFGISDIIEVFTGAWWRPLGLLILKAMCVIALVTCGIVFQQMSRRRLLAARSREQNAAAVQQTGTP